MRKPAVLAPISLCLASLLISFGVKADPGKTCFPMPPGIESSRLDVQDKIVLQKVRLGPNGQMGFIATEYLGSPNLQASVYLKTTEGYCLIGDFDGVTSVEVDKKRKSGVLFNIKTKSISGSDRFFRSYRHIDGKYRLIDCYVKNEKNVRRRCGEPDK